MKKSELKNLEFRWNPDAPKHITNCFAGIIMSAEASENKWNKFLQYLIKGLLTEEFDDIERLEVGNDGYSHEEPQNAE